ncbi:MAG TPA: hypothetical protein VNO23_04140 [Candidatus Binatia bacterium]|nr:hypothetical protein [Candidatus Binatia bacterium]
MEAMRRDLRPGIAGAGRKDRTRPALALPVRPRWRCTFYDRESPAPG